MTEFDYNIRDLYEALSGEQDLAKQTLLRLELASVLLAASAANPVADDLQFRKSLNFAKKAGRQAADFLQEGSKRLSQEFDDLRKKLILLSEQIAAVDAEVSSLQERFAQLQGEYEALLAKEEELRAQSEGLDRLLENHDRLSKLASSVEPEHVNKTLYAPVESKKLAEILDYALKYLQTQQDLVKRHFAANDSIVAAMEQATTIPPGLPERASRIRTLLSELDAMDKELGEIITDGQEGKKSERKETKTHS